MSPKHAGCSFCGAPNTKGLRVVVVPSGKPISHSRTSDVKLTPGYAGACDDCLPLVQAVQEQAKKRLDERSKQE